MFHTESLERTHCCCYYVPMSRKILQVRDTLHIRLGGWFEATASGWGVVAVALVLAVLLTGAVLAGAFG